MADAPRKAGRGVQVGGVQVGHGDFGCRRMHFSNCIKDIKLHVYYANMKGIRKEYNSHKVIEGWEGRDWEPSEGAPRWVARASAKVSRGGKSFHSTVREDGCNLPAHTS